MHYRQQPGPASQIAAELAVDVVVEGCIKREGDSLRIVERAIDGRRDAPLGR